MANRARVAGLTASAARLRAKDRIAIPASPAAFQKEGWHFYDVLGEVKYATNYIANAISKLRLYPALVPDDPRDTPAPDPNPLGDTALRALHGPGGDYSEILREAAINLMVAGECYLLGMELPGAQTPLRWSSWEIKSSDELQFSSTGKVTLKDDPNRTGKDITEADTFIVRIWLRHPRFSSQPDPPLRGVLSSCSEIERIERVIRAAARSRSAGPGILLLPDEISFSSPDPTTDPADADDDVFMADLMENLMASIADEESPASVVPFLMRAPAEFLDKIRRIDLGIDIDEQLIKMERALIRLAQGLNVPPEIVTGKADLNHWTAWQVSDETVSAHVEPLAIPIVSALTQEWYRTYLEAAGMSSADAASRQLWYDPTPLITRPNRSADADYGLEHMALSDDAWRRIKGFTIEDAPSQMERTIRLILQRGSFDPALTAWLLPHLGLTPPPDSVALPDAPPTPKPSAPPPAPRVGEPGNPRPVNPAPPSAASVIVASAAPDGARIGARLLEIDRDLLTRLRATADAALGRAIERATSRLISRYRNDDRFSTILRETPRESIASRIGKATLAHDEITIESLLESSFDPVGTKLSEWSHRAYARASRILGMSSDEAPDDLTVMGHIDEASAWLVGSLASLAADRLFNPSPTVELFGEFDDTKGVPFGVIREAVGRAGGAAPSGIYIGPAGQPIGGVATGEVILGHFGRLGGGVEGWEWVYGETVRTREFLPHRDLDGARFARWDEDTLTNRANWPPVAFYAPGDHAGCLCTHMPVIVMPTEQAA